MWTWFISSNVIRENKRQDDSHGHIVSVLGYNSIRTACCSFKALFLCLIWEQSSGRINITPSSVWRGQKHVTYANRPLMESRPTTGSFWVFITRTRSDIRVKKNANNLVFLKVLWAENRSCVSEFLSKPGNKLVGYPESPVFRTGWFQKVTTLGQRKRCQNATSAYS